ncbi:hypothetical protein RvY_08109 [Ramazzottius varieornatus]|uniref:Uncharacterized protein n=1 Tax=Ramazzottius varieornatus TaxID=947166 RepID=A0A1D1V4R6_RAMVA|nr:hypothetical protein RvY_08109 [Ramazzottius varieornatus]
MCCTPRCCCCCCCTDMVVSTCKSLCEFCKVRRHLRQPWKGCSIAAIVFLVFAFVLIPTGLTLMIYYVDFHNSEDVKLRILAWFGISSFCAGILLLSLGLVFWGCVWRIYQVREKTRIHLEMKQGTLYIGDRTAASRFNSRYTAKDSPMLGLRNYSDSKSKARKSLLFDVENTNPPGDMQLTKIPSRPTSVQTFFAQETLTTTITPVEKTSKQHENGFATIDRSKTPLITSTLARYSPTSTDKQLGLSSPRFPPASSDTRVLPGNSTGKSPKTTELKEPTTTMSPSRANITNHHAPQSV